ncbi:MAG: hypothetical protein AAF089_19175, partial [Bacteroidota bacterium]
QFFAFGPGVPPNFGPQGFGRPGSPFGPPQQDAPPAWRGQPSAPSSADIPAEAADQIEDATILDEDMRRP